MLVNNYLQVFEIIGLDVGEARVGVARAHSVAKLPEPIYIAPTNTAVDYIQSFVKTNAAHLMVIGIPLQPDGKEGEQAKMVRDFAKQLYTAVPIPQIFIDETYTTIEADHYLKVHNPTKADSNDDIAACIILERYFNGAAHV